MAIHRLVYLNWQIRNQLQFFSLLSLDALLLIFNDAQKKRKRNKKLNFLSYRLIFSFFVFSFIRRTLSMAEVHSMRRFWSNKGNASSSSSSSTWWTENHVRNTSASMYSSIRNVNRWIGRTEINSHSSWILNAAAYRTCQSFNWNVWRRPANDTKREKKRNFYSFIYWMRSE